MSRRKTGFDEIGYWSEVKLEIVQKYAAAYSTILSKQAGLTHYYVDGFAGPGVHVSKSTGQPVLGSPLNALLVQPPFKRYFLVDLDSQCVSSLQKAIGERSDVVVLEGDCNEILLRDVFPQIKYEQFRRALCLLDPYGLHLNWEVMAAAGKLGTIDMFINFPIMDMNRNALWSQADRARPEDQARMTAFWGDATWKDVVYKPSRQADLFGEIGIEKAPNQAVVDAFRHRLKEVAGFKNVPEPMPMRNSSNAVVYYLFFASKNATANRIISDIFKRYRDRGAVKDDDR